MVEKIIQLPRTVFVHHVHLMKSKDFWMGMIYGGLIVVFFINFASDSPQSSILQDTGLILNNKEGPEKRGVTNDAANSTKGGRILCWVVTTPRNGFKAERVKKTWGKRCDKLLFMSSQNDTTLPTIGLPIGEESRSQLWNKAQLTLRYIYNNYLDDYDWFFKADDDTYAVMENMRYYLSTLNSSQPLFLGRQFKDSLMQISFLAGGSGYILTRETMRRLVEKGLDQNVCRTKLPGDVDDLIISVCLKRLGAIFADTRDPWGHQRFIPFNPEELYNNTGNNMKTTRKYDIYPVEKGYNCCSNQAISFHYVSGYKMQLLEYLIYKLNIMGA